MQSKAQSPVAKQITKQTKKPTPVTTESMVRDNKATLGLQIESAINSKQLLLVHQELRGELLSSSSASSLVWADELSKAEGRQGNGPFVDHCSIEGGED